MEKYNYLPLELQTRVNLTTMLNADTIAAEIIRLDDARAKHEAAAKDFIKAQSDATAKLAEVEKVFSEANKKAADADKKMAQADLLAANAQTVLDREAQVTAREADLAYREQAFAKVKEDFRKTLGA